MSSRWVVGADRQTLERIPVRLKCLNAAVAGLAISAVVAGLSRPPRSLCSAPEDLAALCRNYRGRWHKPGDDTGPFEEIKTSYRFGPMFSNEMSITYV
jgi:hypothetical protein